MLLFAGSALLLILLTACAPSGAHTGAGEQTDGMATVDPTSELTQEGFAPETGETQDEKESPEPGLPVEPEEPDEAGQESVTQGNSEEETALAAAANPAPAPRPTPAPRRSSAYSEERYNSVVERILSDIITDGMTAREKCRAVYDYVQQHVLYAYVVTADRSDWKKGAYEGFTKGVGDCYTTYACSRSLLTALGIENMEIRRSGSDMTTQHYWNLVNCGDGWYHFDALHRIENLGFECFMATDQECYDYCQANGRQYYYFDSAAYPARVGGRLDFQTGLMLDEEEPEETAPAPEPEETPPEPDMEPEPAETPTETPAESPSEEEPPQETEAGEALPEPSPEEYAEEEPPADGIAPEGAGGGGEEL